MRRGSVQAAEEITGHKYATISVWLHRAAAHGEDITAVLVQHLHLTTVEIDESFVLLTPMYSWLILVFGEAVGINLHEEAKT